MRNSGREPLGLLCLATHESSPRGREDNRLKPMIREIFWENRRRYGARRITKDLLAARQHVVGGARAG